MLSPGKYHLGVPKLLVDNLRYRRRVIEVCRRDRSYRAAVKRMCSVDILYWVNTFVWQFNPNKVGDEVGPFITWPFQDEAFYALLAAIEEREDLVIEKSRDMGATWQCLLADDWLDRFHKNKKFLAISRNADAVDKPEDPDCLFWKLDFVAKNLPDWMNEGRKRLKMVISYPHNECRLVGQASTGKAGVGGRATGAFIDEFSQIEEDREVLARTADTTKCRVFNFTHTDVGTAAYELSQRPDIRKLVMHWSSHPEKNRGLYKCGEHGEFIPLDPAYEYPPDFKPVLDGTPNGGPFPGLRSPWYDAECIRRKSPRAIAMDLDINPTGASAQFYDPSTIRRLVALSRPALWRGELRFDPASATPIALFPMETGNLHLWVWPGHNKRGELLHVPPSLYVIGADLSTGSGATPSCLTIFDCVKKQKIGRLTDIYKDPKQMAPLAVALCRVFRSSEEVPAQLGWECPGVGLTFGNEVVKVHNYRNVHWRVDVFNDVETDSSFAGWYANPSTRLDLHTQYRAALSSNGFGNPCEKSLKECLAYIHKRGTVDHPKAAVTDNPESEGMNHGDHVVADAIANLLAMRKGVVVEAGHSEPDPEDNPMTLAGRKKLWRQQEQEESAWI